MKKETWGQFLETAAQRWLLLSRGPRMLPLPVWSLDQDHLLHLRSLLEMQSLRSHPELLNQNLDCKKDPSVRDLFGSLKTVWFAHNNLRISSSTHWALRLCPWYICIENMPGSLHVMGGNSYSPYNSSFLLQGGSMCQGCLGWQGAVGVGGGEKNSAYRERKHQSRMKYENHQLSLIQMPWPS